LIATSLTFLTPRGALLALTALVPLAALAVAARRGRRTRQLLGLAAPPRAGRWRRPVAVTAVLGLLGVAAAQPVVRSTTSIEVRTDSEVFFVIDISRSMLASRTPGGATRVARARAAADRLREGLSDIPAGVATLTDHVLPDLMPVPDRSVFEQTVRQAARVDNPPPATQAVTATDLGALGVLGTQSFFSPAARHRVAIVLTDGESRPFDVQQTVHALAQAPGVTPIFVRISSSNEAVYGVGGHPEPGYHPDPSSAQALAGLARATSGRAFGEGQLGAAMRAVRKALGRGPVRAEGVTMSTRTLGPYFALAALAPLLLLVGDSLRFHFRRQRRSSGWQRPGRGASPGRAPAPRPG
jgi:hypothetical protein